MTTATRPGHKLADRCLRAVDSLDRVAALLVHADEHDLAHSPGTSAPDRTDFSRARPADGLGSRSPRHHSSSRTPRRGDPDVLGAIRRTETAVAQASRYLFGVWPTYWDAGTDVLLGLPGRQPLPVEVTLTAAGALAGALARIAPATGAMGSVQRRQVHDACGEVERALAAWPSDMLTPPEHWPGPDARRCVRCEERMPERGRHWCSRCRKAEQRQRAVA